MVEINKKNISLQKLPKKINIIATLKILEITIKNKYMKKYFFII